MSIEERAFAWAATKGPNIAMTPPPAIIKVRRAEKNLEWNKDVITELPLDNLDNPIYEVSAAYIEGFTNIPTARLLRKVQNLNAALDSENKWWQRIAVAAGWSRWDVGIQDNEIKEIKNNSIFLAKKSKTFDEEKNVANKAPVDTISINDLNSSKKEKISKEEALRDAKFVSDQGQDEDREAARAIQETLSTKANKHLTFGYFEKAIVNFHSHLAKHLGN